MRVSISMTNFTVPGGPPRLRDYLTRIARVADESGIDTLWVPDHLLPADPMSAIDDAMLEACTTLGFLAAQTERVRLGTLVTAVHFRPPSVMVKAISTLDVLTGGRARFGIGAGYQQDEALAMGLSLPSVSERFERLEETLRLACQMWAGDTAPFVGVHYRLEHPANSPNALRRPHPPILVGGAGEHRTLRLVARYADACNLFDIPDRGKTLRHKLAVLAEHCAETGRPYGDIEKTVTTALAPGESAIEFARRCKDLADFGAEHIVVITRNVPWTAGTVCVAAAGAAAVPQP
ncbi:TIGR03560 family F420-dependent LLM class oxidoreductase [Nocardia sp. NPDC051463]|uniref:TIGR03560 family F420-dependent LLM class oxidoreductase n=1 Tax=Nocardia sp. NPDC051463 TaxID=3154845 RepID=UPI0034502176